MSALWAFLGVLAGVAFTSAVTFWSTRRKELEAAAIAGTLLTEELRMLVEDPGDTTDHAARVAVIQALWLQRRDALVLHMEPALFSEINRPLVHAGRRGSLPADEAHRLLDRLAPETDRIRSAHQAFIVTPLLKYLRTRPWRRRERGSAVSPS